MMDYNGLHITQELVASHPMPEIHPNLPPAISDELQRLYIENYTITSHTNPSQSVTVEYHYSDKANTASPIAITVGIDRTNYIKSIFNQGKYAGHLAYIADETGEVQYVNSYRTAELNGEIVTHSDVTQRIRKELACRVDELFFNKVLATKRIEDLKKVLEIRTFTHKSINGITISETRDQSGDTKERTLEIGPYLQIATYERIVTGELVQSGLDTYKKDQQGNLLPIKMPDRNKRLDKILNPTLQTNIKAAEQAHRLDKHREYVEVQNAMYDAYFDATGNYIVDSAFDPDIHDLSTIADRPNLMIESYKSDKTGIKVTDKVTSDGILFSREVRVNGFVEIIQYELQDNTMIPTCSRVYKADADGRLRKIVNPIPNEDGYTEHQLSELKEIASIREGIETAVNCKTKQHTEDIFNPNIRDLHLLTEGFEKDAN